MQNDIEKIKEAECEAQIPDSSVTSNDETEKEASETHIPADINEDVEQNAAEESQATAMPMILA